MSTIYKETEYYMTDLGDKKVILSIQDSFDFGSQTDLDGDLSNTELVIFAEDVILSKKIKAKSIQIYANSITTVSKTKPLKTGSADRTALFQMDDDLSLPETKLIELFDRTNERYVCVSSVVAPDGSIMFREQTQSDLKNIDLSAFMSAHPTQCSMLLQKAMLLYRMGDPVSNKKDLDKAIVLLQKLENRLKIFHDLKLDKDADKDPPLAKLYKENEALIGAINSIDSFRSTYSTAVGLLGQIKKGSDYYGNSYNYVPLASKEFYESILQKQIDNFQYIESNFFQFLNASRKEEERKKDLNDAISYLNQVSLQADDENASLKVRASDTESEIKNLESQFQAKKELVKKRLEEFKNDIDKKFNLDIKSVLSSVTTLAFLKESPTAGFIIAGAGIGYDIYEGATTIKNDEGITVQKDYLVNEVVGFEGDLDSSSLDEQSKKLSDGTIKLDDPGANKLIVEEQQLIKFLHDFCVHFPKSTKALEDAFQDYVNLVVERNNKVMYYNAIVTLIIKNHNIIKDATQKKAIINEDNLSRYKPSLPAFTALMSNLYTMAQAQVMESLYLTERAFRFWSLSDQKPVSKIFASNQVTAINTSVLKQAQSSILNFYEQVIEDRKRIEPQNFPAKEEGRGSIIWELSQDQVNTLKEGNDGNYTILFPISPAMKDTAKDVNPFSGFADIRLTRVFVWIDGVETQDNELNLTITHTGNERLIDTDNYEFDFKHNSKEVSFKYDIKTKTILEGGAIGDTTKDATYALVGPFTWWNLSIVGKYNNKPDLSKVTGVRLEFQGNNYPFNQ